MNSSESLKKSSSISRCDLVLNYYRNNRSIDFLIQYVVYFFTKFKGNTAAGFGVDQSQFIRNVYVTAKQGPFVYLIYRLLHGIFKIASFFSSRLPYISQIKSCYRLEDSKYTVTWKAYI